MHDDPEGMLLTAVVQFGGDCIVAASASTVGCDIDEPKSGSVNVRGQAEQRKGLRLSQTRLASPRVGALS